MSLVKWVILISILSSCAGEAVTRARIEKDEDKFCASRALIKQLESKDASAE